jgi:ABC-type lipoprotein release transport system permease subunit
VAGSVLGYMTAGTLLPDVFGIAAFYRYPTAAVSFALVAAVLLAAGAGYLAGRAAGRLKVSKALGYE